MEDKTKKTLVSILNFVILIINGLIAMLSTPQTREIACNVVSHIMG